MSDAAFIVSQLFSKTTTVLFFSPKWKFSHSVLSLGEKETIKKRNDAWHFVSFAPPSFKNKRTWKNCIQVIRLLPYLSTIWERKEEKEDCNEGNHHILGAIKGEKSLVYYKNSTMKLHTTRIESDCGVFIQIIISYWFCLKRGTIIWEWNKACQWQTVKSKK